MIKRWLKRLDGAASRWLCRRGVHYWSHPGGECTQCGAPDTLWDDKATATRRIHHWR